MPIVQDVSIGAVDDPDKKLESVVKQINDNFRAASNEDLTRVYKDTSGTNRIIIGVLPDDTAGLVISKSGVDVLTVFS